MEYRCPYCGEPAFSLRIKLGIVSKFGTAPRCPHCKRVAERRTDIGGNMGQYFVLILLALASVACCILGVVFRISVLIPVGILCFIAVYIAGNYLFIHFDKIYSKERNADPIFHFSSAVEERLWPTIRKGEIYVIQFPKENAGGSNCPRVIGLIDKMEKSGGNWLFTIRVIQFQEMDEIPAGVKLRLVTNGMLVVPGIVTQGTVAA